MLATGRPVLLDFYQHGCATCKVMDGIVNELAEEYAESAHIVKVNVRDVPGAGAMFKIRSTPTFVLLGTAPKKQSKKARQRRQSEPSTTNKVTPRWRGNGLVKKDFLAGVLESNGATRLLGVPGHQVVDSRLIGGRPPRAVCRRFWL